jgi:type II secretory pathway predicted ATPase ExeA
MIVNNEKRAIRASWKQEGEGQMYANPFTPVFGNEPPFMAGRDRQINDALKGLDNAPGDPNRITVFTGSRGSGKTTLLARIAAEAEERGWISVHTPAIAGMLKDLAEQVERKAAGFLPKRETRVLTGIQVAGFGVTSDPIAEQQVGWRLQMDGYLDELQEQGVGLLFTIDEVTPEVAEIIQFISIFQVFVMEKRNVALMMAGLPGNVMQMFQGESISFLRRAFLRKLEPVSQPEVRAVIKKTVELAKRTIDEDALRLAAESTEGLPFLIQLIGYHSFNQSNERKIAIKDVESGIDAAKEDMEHMILDATVKSLSEGDLRFLIAMTDDEGESRMTDIAKRLGTSASNASHYRRRLINQGIITQAGRGKVEYSMPMLKTLLRERFASN